MIIRCPECETAYEVHPRFSDFPCEQCAYLLSSGDPQRSRQADPDYDAFPDLTYGAIKRAIGFLLAWFACSFMAGGELFDFLFPGPDAERSLTWFVIAVVPLQLLLTVLAATPSALTNATHRPDSGKALRLVIILGAILGAVGLLAGLALRFRDVLAHGSAA